MQQLSRKSWCRSAFLAFCAVPTILVGIWILSRAIWGDGSLQKDDWERELSLRLGMTFKLEAVSYPQFGLAELKNVELLDAETGEPIARAALLEVTRTAGVYTIVAVSPEIEAGKLGRLSQFLQERLLCQGGSGIGKCDFSARELTLNDNSAPRTLVNLQAALEPAETGPRLTTSFQWPEEVDAEYTVACSLSRNVKLSPPATSISLSTGQAKFPCRLAAHFWPPLERLGSEAEFRGKVSAHLVPQGGAELSGTFSGVDLDALISEQFPQVLSGKATVRIERASLEDGRLHSATGSVEVASGGRISRSLLLAAAEHLKLQNDAGSSGSEVLTYRRMSGSFRIDGPELHLLGSADPGNPGVLITNHTAPLLSASTNHTAIAASLARVLLPDSSLQVPLASQTSGLVRLLPSPNISTASQNGQAARRSHTPTRLSPGGSSKDIIHER